MIQPISPGTLLSPRLQRYTYRSRSPTPTVPTTLGRPRTSLLALSHLALVVRRHLLIEPRKVEHGKPREPKGCISQKGKGIANPPGPP